jgi:hypothetical protein
MRRSLRSSLFRWGAIVVAVLLAAHWYGWADTRDAIAAAGKLAWGAIRATWPLLLAALLLVVRYRAGLAGVVRRLRRHPQPAVISALGVSALGVLLLVFAVVPTWLVPDGVIADAAALYGARNDVRTTALQAVAGLVLLLGAYFTWRQVQNSTRTLEHTREQLEVTRQQVQVSDRQAREQLEVARQGQVTERFTRAIDQLGQRGEDPLDRLDVRLGGIYALERIARDSEVDRPAIAEILTAYIRTHSPRPLTPGQPSADLTRDQVRDLPDLRTRAPDVQAALTVLSRGRFAALATVGHGRLDLRAADLRNANLHGASLEWADLSDAHLEGALLAGARLEGADLRHARLEGAHLAGAKLKRANLADAHLEGADLGGADLKEALYLDKAHLAGAEATDDPRHPTRWPDGFDWRAAGVDVVYTVELEDERQAGGEVPRGRRSGTDHTATPRAAGDWRRPRR